MIMEISRKKIFIAAVVFFCFFLLTVFGVWFGLGSRQKVQEESMEKAAQVQECVKTVGEMDFPKIIDLTEQLSKDSAFQKKIKFYIYPHNLLIRHLRCEFLKEQNEEGKNSLIDYATEARQRIFYYDQSESWEKSKEKIIEILTRPEKSFITTLALGNMTEICPNKLPVSCREDNGVFFLESDEWCDHICETLAQYEEDKDKLNEEVINFKNWKETIKDYPNSPFIWQLAVAYRFGGKSLALKICDNVADLEKGNTCISTAVSFETRDLPCETAFKRLAQLICDYQYKNY